MTSEIDFEAIMDAISRVYSLREGHTLTLQDYEAIQTFDQASREDQERAADAFHRGYEQGLREGGTAEVADLKKQISDLSTNLASARALQTIALKDRETLIAAIERVWKADVYEGREMRNGISLEMVKAIREAAVTAGLVEEEPE